MLMLPIRKSTITTIRRAQSGFLENIENIAIAIVKGILATDGKEWVSEEMLLKVGSRGDEVKILQTQLNQLGYDAGKADGIFGTRTDNASGRSRKPLA